MLVCFIWRKGRADTLIRVMVECFVKQIPMLDQVELVG